VPDDGVRSGPERIVSGPFTECPTTSWQPDRRIEVDDLASARGLDDAERRFYVVMHHLATVLWMRGRSTEALAALTAVMEWAGQEQAT
jgi:hypothetical protein